MTFRHASDLDRMKHAAAARAVEEVGSGMVLGLGSGSTAEIALEILAGRIAKGLRITGIPTSEKMAALARRLGVPLTSFSSIVGVVETGLFITRASMVIVGRPAGVEVIEAGP